MFLDLGKSSGKLVFVGALVLLSQIFCLSNSQLAMPAFADSEASSEASSESGGGGGRGRGWFRYQQQQQRMAAQQARMQQQQQQQQQRKQNAAAARQRNKPFKVSDYIHEYGPGKSRGHFQQRNFGATNSGNAAGSAVGNNSGASGSPLGNPPATGSVPYQKFPPK